MDGIHDLHSHLEEDGVAGRGYTGAHYHRKVDEDLGMRDNFQTNPHQPYEAEGSQGYQDQESHLHFVFEFVHEETNKGGEDNLAHHC